MSRLKKSFDNGLKQAGLEYVDLWRITCLEQSGQHDKKTIDELVKALDWAKKSGRARFTGISSHDRPHIKKLIETYPQLEVICTPYTAKTKVLTDESGLWAAMKKQDVGWFGIKPFASNSLFKGSSKPGDAHEAEDNVLARLAIRYVLCNPAITAPIPGLITVDQVDNVAKAVKERRRAGQGRKGPAGRCHGKGLGRPAAQLPVVERLGVRLTYLPSPPLRGRGVGGEGVFSLSHAYPLTPDPSPPKRGRGEEDFGSRGDSR